MLELLADKLEQIAGHLSDAVFFFLMIIQDVHALHQRVCLGRLLILGQRNQMKLRFLGRVGDEQRIAAFDLSHDLWEGFAPAHPCFDPPSKQRREAVKLLVQRLLRIYGLRCERILLHRLFRQRELRARLDRALGVFKRRNPLERVENPVVFIDEDDVGIFAHQFNVELAEDLIADFITQRNLHHQPTIQSALLGGQN